eukprot:jgi/Ulvmu1/1767/UM118_0006.1
MMDMDVCQELRSVDVTVPAETAACIVFPGPVQNTEKAVAMLGGHDAISSSLKMSNSTIKCAPRRSDGASHPLLSYQYDCSRILLKVTRSEAGGEAGFKVEAVANITKSHEFRGLADFQVVSSAVPDLDRSGDTVTAANKPDVAEPNGGEHPLLVIPPELSRTDGTFAYRYRGFAKKDVRTEIAWTPHRRVMIVAYDVGTVPQPQPRDDRGAAEAATRHAPLRAALRALFDVRPCWLLPDLMERVGTAQQGEVAAVEAALSVLAYRFQSGPWQTCLIRRGFDPREVQGAWRWQVLTCRLPDKWKGSLQQQALDLAAGAATSPWAPLLSGPGMHAAACGTHAATGGVVPAQTITTSYKKLTTLQHIPPTKVSFFQVCDMWHTHVCDALRAAAAVSGESLVDLAPAGSAEAPTPAADSGAAAVPQPAGGAAAALDTRGHAAPAADVVMCDVQHEADAAGAADEPRSGGESGTAAALANTACAQAADCGGASFGTAAAAAVDPCTNGGTAASHGDAVAAVASTARQPGSERSAACWGSGTAAEQTQCAAAWAAPGGSGGGPWDSAAGPAEASAGGEGVAGLLLEGYGSSGWFPEDAWADAQERLAAALHALLPEGFADRPKAQREDDSAAVPADADTSAPPRPLTGALPGPQASSGRLPKLSAAVADLSLQAAAAGTADAPAPAAAPPPLPPASSRVQAPPTASASSGGPDWREAFEQISKQLQGSATADTPQPPPMAADGHESGSEARTRSASPDPEMADADMAGAEQE